MEETLQLMRLGRYREARDRIHGMLDPLPKNPAFNLLIGQCLMRLRFAEAAIPHFKTAIENDPEAGETVSIWLGLAYHDIGREAQALPYLEMPCPDAAMDDLRRKSLAECTLNLERYEDALKILPTDSLWSRHRALLYQGKGAEALKFLEAHDEMETSPMRALQLREEGDFEGARKTIETALSKSEPHSAPWRRLKRSELALSLEAGDLARLETIAKELAVEPDMNVQGEALHFGAMGHLLAGRKEAARAAAWEFLAKIDKEYSPLRLERMMLRHLVGELQESDLEAEAKLVSRFHANDLYWHLAVATGDRAWAEKALQATPGHNYPYHSIQRILRK
jgi:lipopolysaccharide biosynthesis regulator YciM